MAYKTLMLQIYHPSKHKRVLINNALLRYSQALQMLITRYEYKIDTLAESEERISQRQLLSLIDKETAKDLNKFHVQPFKDSLKIEFASLAAAYIEQKRDDCNTRYPLAYLDPLHYHEAIDHCINCFEYGNIKRKRLEAECSKLIARVGRLRSLYFGRYSINRDYCLLYDVFKDRFYAKLYLLNSADGYFSKMAASSLSLQYITKGMPAMVNQDDKKRYIIVPLAFGKKQYNDLKKGLENPGIFHTARLVKKSNCYYLMVNIECEPAPILSTISTMGVSRSPSGGLDYVICDPSGKFLKHGRIAKQAEPDQVEYALCKRIVKIAWENRSQVILESNGGKNDKMATPKNKSGNYCLSNGQYTALAGILKYKLPEKRLPPPIEVSANGLFLTCPRCEKRTLRNRISDELFACIECGYASEAEWIGSENLAKRLIKYQRDKVPLTVSKKNDSLLFYNKILGFECILSQSVTDYKPMYDELSRYVQRQDGTFQNNSKKYAIWKKLRQSPDIRNAVRLILK